MAIRKGNTGQEYVVLVTQPYIGGEVTDDVRGDVEFVTNRKLLRLRKFRCFDDLQNQVCVCVGVDTKASG